MLSGAILCWGFAVTKLQSWPERRNSTSILILAIPIVKAMKEFCVYSTDRLSQVRWRDMPDFEILKCTSSVSKNFLESQRPELQNKLNMVSHTFHQCLMITALLCSLIPSKTFWISMISFVGVFNRKLWSGSAQTEQAGLMSLVVLKEEIKQWYCAISTYLFGQASVVLT